MGQLLCYCHSFILPFSIGKVEDRMMLFAKEHQITLASDELYMSSKQLQHCMRTSKATKGLVVSDADLIGFPKNRFHMELYYDGECFIYTDGQSKFIVHPNYKMKISRELVAQVNLSQLQELKTLLNSLYPNIIKYKKLATRDQLYFSERNQAARSNCSSSLRFRSHATVPHIVALPGFSFHTAKVVQIEQKTKFYLSFFEVQPIFDEVRGTKIF